MRYGGAGVAVRRGVGAETGLNVWTRTARRCVRHLVCWPRVALCPDGITARQLGNQLPSGNYPVMDGCEVHPEVLAQVALGHPYRVQALRKEADVGSGE